MSSTAKQSDRLEQRKDLDAAQSETRHRADDERSEARSAVDSNRYKVQSDRQAQEGLDRERAVEDEGRRVERGQSDAARGTERRVGDAVLARERVARTDSDKALEVTVDHEARRIRSLKEALGLVETELNVVAKSLTEMLASKPAGTFPLTLTEGVTTIRTASVRMKQLLQDALDPGDSRQRYHDVGGSG